MRRFLHRNRWASLPVVVLLLFATSGMALSRMTCLMSGRTVLALGNLEECCPEHERSDAPTVSAVCCVFAQAGGDVEPFVASASLEAPPISMAMGHVPMVAAGVSHRPLPGFVHGRPPPMLAILRLAVLSTFRI